MRHWLPERGNRPMPMERWVFVGLLIMGSISIGMAISLIYMQDWLWAGVGFANGALALGYSFYRVREAGWP